jgi:hypothetical protein
VRDRQGHRGIESGTDRFVNLAIEASVATIATDAVTGPARTLTRVSRNDLTAIGGVTDRS